ncbi:MAG: hypothetical protein IPF94_10420 [Betaproteobacteria bacterium]|nr:hypothetical protein [Betaproteobacteria bacterium]
MNTHPLLVTVLLAFPTIGVGLLARWVMAQVESEFRSDARLEKADFDIGTWSTPRHPMCSASHR